MLERLALILAIVCAAGVAAAEPSGRPAPESKPTQSLFPIAGLAGGLVAPRAR